MSLGIKHLSSSINDNTAGILWITDHQLDLSTPGVYEFNYLLNGVLIKSLNKINLEEQNNNFFLGESFGHPLFIGHTVFKDKKDLDQIYSHLKISDNFINDDSLIYIFNKSKNTANLNLLKVLSEKYKNIKFEILNI